MCVFRKLTAFIFVIAIIVIPLKSISIAIGQTTSERLTKLLYHGNFLYTQGNYGQSLKLFWTVLTLDPNNTFALDRIGMNLLKLGDEKDAIKYFDRSLE